MNIIPLRGAAAIGTTATVNGDGGGGEPCPRVQHEQSTAPTVDKKRAAGARCLALQGAGDC